MRILITGGAGYLGSIMVPHLLALGHEVTVVDTFMFNQSSLLDCCAQPRFSLVRGDARDRGVMQKLMGKADVIIPLACLTGAPLCKLQPDNARTTIVEALRLMLELRSQEQRILYPTTNSGYGVGEEGMFCTEESPLRPISLYGQLKCEAEAMLLDAGNAITYRLATVFGASPRMRLDLLVNDFTFKAVMQGYMVLFEAHFKRNYIHIRDIARAFEHGITHFEAMKDKPYNVGLSSANLSKWELCEEIQKQVPSFYFVEAPIGKDPDQRNYIVSNARIEGTGFMPQYSLTDGITELLKAFQVMRLNQFSNV